MSDVLPHMKSVRGERGCVRRAGAAALLQQPLVNPSAGNKPQTRRRSASSSGLSDTRAHASFTGAQRETTATRFNQHLKATPFGIAHRAVVAACSGPSVAEGYGEAMCTRWCVERLANISKVKWKIRVDSWLCLLCMCLALWGPVCSQCPESCSCAWDTATVSCVDAGLYEIPVDIPQETVSLHLERNFIRTIPETTFSELVHLRDLYLSHNRIDSLSTGALRHLGPELRLLDLSHNQLRQASREDFGLTRAKTRLYHNPWHCDCTLQELMETLNLEPETVNGIICESSVRGMGEGSRWDDPSSLGEHAGQPIVKLLDSGVNFCSLQRKTTDIAMLVTMFVWFFMVIVYVVYYVRQNQAEARRHLEYLKSLPSPRKTPTETDTLSTGF